MNNRGKAIESPAATTPVQRVLGLALMFLCFGLSPAAFSSQAEPENTDIVAFSSEQLRRRYLELVQELRCPKCQNQNLADSNSMIAEDLRNEVYRQLEEGKSDREIVTYLVERYGDFVHYRPPLKAATLALWVLPGLFLCALLLVPLLLLRRQRRNGPAPLSGHEREQLDTLLRDLKE